MIQHRYPWLGGLTPAQKTAATSVSRALAVIAGPGSGKTRTLAARIVDLVERRAVHPATIVAFTFTRSAAAELKARAVELGGENLALVEVTTFHAWAARVLRADPLAVGLPQDFQLAREEDAERALGSMYEGPLRRPEAGRCTISAFRRVLSRFYSEGVWPDGKADAALLACYFSRLAEFGLVPFGMLEPALTRGLAESAEIQARAAERPTVLVDEAHDVSPLEMGAVEWLAARQDSAGLTVVLDPRQAIFGWRGALGGAVLDRMERLGAERVVLSRSFRFGPAIAAHATVLQEASGWTWAPPVEGAPDMGPGAVHAIHGSTIAAHVGDAVKAYGGGNVAVLCRSRRECELVAAALNDVAETIHGTDREPSWFRLAEAMARLAVNRADNAAFRVLYEAEEPYLASRARFETFAARAGRAHDLLEEYLDQLGEVAAERASLLGFLVHDLAETMGFRDLAERAYRFDVRDRTAPADVEAEVAPFLSSIGVSGASVEEAVDILATRTDADAFQDLRARGKVAVSTVHAAKGREWDAVFVVSGDRWPWGLTSKGTAYAAEELRVYFVAVTRAKRELAIVHGGEAPLDEIGLVPGRAT